MLASLGLVMVWVWETPPGWAGRGLVFMVTGLVVVVTLFCVVGDGFLGGCAVDGGFVVGVGGEHGG